MGTDSLPPLQRAPSLSRAAPARSSSLGGLGPVPDARVKAVLADLDRRLKVATAGAHGFPAARDIDYTPLAPLRHRWIVNVGGPERDGAEPRHVKDLERDLLAEAVAVFGGSWQNCWGYVGNGSTESTRHALHLARNRHPDAVLYYSEAAHYSVPKVAEQLGLLASAVRVAAGENGEMRYEALAAAAARHAARPAIVVATLGTTMTEAVDDVEAIQRTLNEVGVGPRWVHADGALAGFPLALAGGPTARLLSTDNGTAPATSLGFSGHKFFGTPSPSGVVFVRRDAVLPDVRHVDYIDGIDSTDSGCRSGHAILELWYALARFGRVGHHRRATAARAVAANLLEQLAELEWPAWRAHPETFTVVLATPPAALVERWSLASSADGWSHFICMPGVTDRDVDEFVADLAAVVSPADRSRTAVG